jgi:hypothetical protein
MVTKPGDTVSVEPELATAIDRWGRGVVGAPRHLSTLITAVESRNDVLHRVYTYVVRRELHEERVAASERYTSSPRVQFARVDPYAGTLESLKADTIHIGVCSVCSASGLMWCSNCGGRQVASCGSCGGAGQVLNLRTSRLNKCRSCKGSGSVSCRGCNGSGKVMCYPCRGSGHQWVWLAYTETRQPRTMVYPETPVAVAHPQLRMPKALAAEDLDAFWLETELHGAGPLAADDLPSEARTVVEHEWAKVDRRLERVIFQQYMRLSVVCWDVRYQMCGTTGMIPVSGKTPTCATTPTAMRPIRRRRIFWPSTCAILGVGAMMLAGSAMGRAAYFEASNGVVLWLWLGALIVSVPCIGGLLRAWRPVARVNGLRAVELGLAVAWVLMLVSIAVIGVVTRPEIRAVDEALAAGDVDRARVVLDALLEREGATAPILEVEDAVLLAEAAAMDGEQRLAKLDLIASHHGTRTSEASALARADRLAKIRSLIASGQAAEAIAAIERDFASTWPDDPEIAEERARAQELLAEACPDDPCRLLVRRAAQEAYATPERAAAVEDVRGRMFARLAVLPGSAALNPPERIRASDEVASFADLVLADVLDDAALSAAATAAKSWAAQERAAIAVLGSDLETLLALFPGLKQSSPELASVSLDGAELFFTIDAGGKCRGIYAVGPKGHRELDGASWSAQRIVSQAFGRPVPIPASADAKEVSRTRKEGKTKIVARWRGGEPIELRIGDAKP